MFSSQHQIFTGKPLRVLSAGMLVFLVVLLVLVRVIYPGSDAYARLSWSSALLTDEGFYIHNARNLVLFGHARTDEFNNALIMPLLHLLQVLVFRVGGVGAMQARAISIGLSLMTLLVFWDALRRAWGRRCAWVGLALLGLDPTFALYNRLALMDTPACLPLCAAWWLWVIGQEKGEGQQGRRGREGEREEGETRSQEETGSAGWRSLLSLSPSLPLPLFLCGMCLGLAYCVRGLTAIVVAVPVVLLAAPVWQQWRHRRLEHDIDFPGVENTRSSGLRPGVLRTQEVSKMFVADRSENEAANVPQSASAPLRFSLLSLVVLVSGLALVLLAYVIVWYIPNKIEMARVNAYYMNHQLRPDSLRHLWQNVQHAFFGDERGIAPYLFRHTPVTFALALLCLAGQEKGERRKEKGKAFTDMPSVSIQNNFDAGAPIAADQQALSPFSFLLSPFSYLRLWLLLMWGFLAVINYAPDRYYILFYPAMCGLAAYALCDMPALVEQIGRAWWKRAALGGFLAYHLGEAVGHHGSAASDVCLIAFTAAVTLALALPSWNVSQWRERIAGKHSDAAVSKTPASDAGTNAVSARSSDRSSGRIARRHAAIMRLLPVLLLTLWALVTVTWLIDWLLHIRYTQRDADAWLAVHLPADSVLIGDAAPGLCLNNRFQAVSVIAGLCNDDKPVEQFAPRPRYIVILDDGGPNEKYKEPWWRSHYPALVAPGRRIYYAPRMVRFPVGVYAVASPSK